MDPSGGTRHACPNLGLMISISMQFIVEILSNNGYTSPSLWTEFLTHACENITFPQLRLRTVKSEKLAQENTSQSPRRSDTLSVLR